MAKIVGRKLVIDGFIYVRLRQRGNQVNWDCQRVRAGECTACAVTVATAHPLCHIVVVKGPTTALHSHVPNQAACKAEVIMQKIKGKAMTNPAQPPAQLLRDELSAVPPSVLSQLPERQNVNKAIRRERRKNMPPNPKSLEELQGVPNEYQKTLHGNQFLLLDRISDDEDEGRVLVFATRRNIEMLCKSPIWTSVQRPR